ncbi:ERB1 protein, partial [Campylorhamphus procurvoides]|nr:ERB1 protein [Campylorhamphus procurvoides]
PDCDDNVNFGTVPQTVAFSFFAPGAAAARNWNKLKHLACWSIKQFNTTSNILSQLLTNVNDIRHAVLQNRAAIDFLLLAQGHGCQEFEGMCCMNLSDHSKSIHKQLSTLRERLNHITYGTSPLSDWLASLGLTGWV